MSGRTPVVGKVRLLRGLKCRPGAGRVHFLTIFFSKEERMETNDERDEGTAKRKGFSLPGKPSDPEVEEDAHYRYQIDQAKMRRYRVKAGYLDARSKGKGEAYGNV
jgi:hypothetical protein